MLDIYVPYMILSASSVVASDLRYFYMQSIPVL